MSAQQKPEVAENLKRAEAVLSASVTEALNATQKAVEQLAALLGTDPAAAVEAMKQAGQAASDRVAGVADDARRIGRAKADDLGAAVRLNPLAWLAAAFGLGLIFGLWRQWNGRS